MIKMNVILFYLFILNFYFINCDVVTVENNYANGKTEVDFLDADNNKRELVISEDKNVDVNVPPSSNETEILIHITSPTLDLDFSKVVKSSQGAGALECNYVFKFNTPNNYSLVSNINTDLCSPSENKDENWPNDETYDANSTISSTPSTTTSTTISSTISTTPSTTTQSTTTQSTTTQSTTPSTTPSTISTTQSTISTTQSTTQSTTPSTISTTQSTTPSTISTTQSTTVASTTPSTTTSSTTIMSSTTSNTTESITNSPDNYSDLVTTEAVNITTPIPRCKLFRKLIYQN